MSTRVGKGFFKEEMENLKVFTAKVCKTFRQFHSRKQFSIEIRSKMILM